MPVYVAENPLDCVVKGAGKTLEDLGSEILWHNTNRTNVLKLIRRLHRIKNINIIFKL